MNSLTPAGHRKFEFFQQEHRDARRNLREAAGCYERWDVEVRERCRTYKPAAEIAAAEQQLAEAKAAQAAWQARFDNSSEVSTALNIWLRDMDAQAAFADVAAVPVKLRKGETLPQAVERARQTIVSLEADLERVRTAALPIAELKAQAAALVASGAAFAKPQISGSDGQLRLQWPHALTHPTFAAWFAPDALIARLHAEIDALQLDDAAAVPAAERAGRIADLEAQILQAERSEEALIVQAGADDLFIPRRPDANPHALLGIQPVDRGAKAA